MTDEEIRNQYRFTHHALVGLFKLCKESGKFDGDTKAEFVIDQAEAVLRGDTGQIDASDPASLAFFSLLKSMADLNSH